MNAETTAEMSVVLTAEQQRFMWQAVLDVEQQRFLWLHAKDAVVKWAWQFGELYLRAYTERGHTATISAGGLRDLIAAGLMVRGAGIADVYLTERGKAAAG